MTTPNRIRIGLRSGNERRKCDVRFINRRPLIRRGRWMLATLAICGGMNSAGIRIGLLAGATILVGCGGQDTPDVQVSLEHPLRKLRSKLRNQSWEEAWQYSDAVLAAHPDNASAIADVALVAQQLGKSNQVASLLRMACRAESYQDDARVRQATIAMIAAGKLYDAIDFLDQVVQTYPLRNETRRWLFELHLNSGNPTAARPHGRVLVRQRHFDTKLLLSLDTDEQPVKESPSVAEMVQRNPDDKRPLLRRAKTLYQHGQYDEAVQVLSEIVGRYPTFDPAQAWLGRSLAAGAQWDKLDQWAQSQSGRLASESADFWLAKADAAAAQNSPTIAMKLYWEACQRNSNLREPWEKLLRLMRDQNVNDPELVASVAERADLIRTLASTKDRFDKLGNISQKLAIQIAQQLLQLGRLWEAEAWASLATTLPPDDAVEVDKTRDQIIDQLNPQTPWQITEGRPELQTELPPSLGIRRPESAPSRS